MPAHIKPNFLKLPLGPVVQNADLHNTDEVFPGGHVLAVP